MSRHHSEPVLLADPQAEVYHSAYRGLCPTCRRLCDGVRLLRDGKVYGRRFCPEHGVAEALLSSDAGWFLGSLSCSKPASVPLRHATSVERGCPWDCGLCPDHGQHTCLPIVEITNHCNLECPICLARISHQPSTAVGDAPHPAPFSRLGMLDVLSSTPAPPSGRKHHCAQRLTDLATKPGEKRGQVDSHHGFMMTMDQLAGIIDGLIATEGQVDTINLSGGEPTLHPELLALVDRARRPEISRVSISSNGLRLAEDPGLCRALAERGIYLNLQLDGLQEEPLTRLRGGGDHVTSKRQALANLHEAGCRTTLVTTVARGVNEHLLGEALELLLSSDGVLSLMVQPLAYLGRGAAFGPADPCDVLTIPEVVRLLAEQSRGVLQQDDFVPLPCSHPSCFALSYLLGTEDGGWVPFPRFVDSDRYLDLLANRGTVRPDERLENTLRDTIDELWSGSDQIPDSERILRALAGVLKRMYPEDRALKLAERLRLGEATVKTVFIHAFMDVHSFDLERLRKCCTHYAMPDGRLMPGCAYNLWYRGGVGEGAVP